MEKARARDAHTQKGSASSKNNDRETTDKTKTRHVVFALVRWEQRATEEDRFVREEAKERCRDIIDDFE